MLETVRTELLRIVPLPAAAKLLPNPAALVLATELVVDVCALRRLKFIPAIAPMPPADATRRPASLSNVTEEKRVDATGGATAPNAAAAAAEAAAEKPVWGPAPFGGGDGEGGEGTAVPKNTGDTVPMAPTPRPMPKKGEPCVGGDGRRPPP